MRGLPFPTNTAFHPDAHSDHGTPPTNLDDIPIDPALAGAESIDTAIATIGNALPAASQQLTVQDQPPLPLQRHYPHEPLQYDQGPQGDPFAPQPPAPYLQIPETELPRFPRPQRRKRKPRREKECGFCQGSDSNNKLGQSEPMVSCEECGRSGHPSCMELGKVTDVVRSYPWRCIECKICEICQEKGDDARILFCDFCDRGWHMDCLEPRLDKEPPGQWHCPLCPPLDMLPPHPDPTQALDDAVRPSGLGPSTGPDGSTSEPLEADYEVDVQVDGSSTEESSSSDTDSDETVNAPAVRYPRSIKKKRPANRTSLRPSKRMRIKVRSPAPPLIVRLRLPPKGKGKEREDDMEHNIFEDLLPPTERDTSKTNIDSNDRARFEKSRLVAEEKLYPAPVHLPSAAENPDTPIAGPSSRPLRSATLHQLSIPPSTSPISPVPSTPGFVPLTPGTFSQTPNTPIVTDRQSTLRIRTIRFGPYDIHPWYDAPFPEEYANLPDGRLWICEFCLKYMRSRFAFGRHRMKCKARHPPGDEIYRDGAVSIFEVDGRKNKIYCQNLCLLSKMFLDHKSLFYDVEPFLFYVMAEVDDIGAHFVGYFSKEKCSPKQYNVSCIMTLPVRQRQGWGNYLIDFSYLLSKKEERVGSPEKPLSGLGALGYKNYWTLALMRYLKSAPPGPTLEDITRATSMTVEDIYTILVQQDMITVDTFSNSPRPGQSIKFLRGRRNGIARRHLQRHNSQKQMEGGGNKPNAPFVVPAHYEISWDQEMVDRWLETWEKKGYLRLKPEKLKWTPFVLSRTKAGVELLQTEPGLGFGVIGHNGTPRSPMDSGTPMLDNGDRAKSLGGSSNGQTEQVAVRDVGEVTAAQLFDDLLDENMATPKRQLRHSHRDASLAVPSRTASAEPAPQGADSDALLDHTHSDAQMVDDVATSVPVKRPRGRPPRVRPPDKTPTASRSFSTESGPAPPSRPTSPRKRRKLDLPSPEDPPTAVDPTHTEQHGDQPDRAVDHHPLIANGDHGMNGVHLDFTHSLDTSSPVVTAEVERVLGTEDPPDSTLQECTDVKSEDLGTPLTGLTSRHSVPSDDTVFVVEGVNGSAVRSKISGEGERISPLPNLRGTAVDGSKENAVGLPMVIEEDSDLDAEGEPDDEI